MATRRAALRAAVDSVKPLHQRKTHALGGSFPSWNGGWAAGGKRSAGAPLPLAPNGGVSGRPSLVQGGGGRPSRRRPAPATNGAPARASRRSTLNGVRLANGQRVDGTRPAYLRQPRGGQRPKGLAAPPARPGTRQGGGARWGGVAASSWAAPGGQAVVTDLSKGVGGGSAGGAEKVAGRDSDLIVVLDMDECLIHSQFLSQQGRALSAPELDGGGDDDGGGEGPVMADKYRQAEARPTRSTAFHTDEEAESIIAANCEYFRYHLADGDLVHVNKRPNLDVFLREVTGRFETHVFTAAMEVYANPLLDRLESDLAGAGGGPASKFDGRFYREDCILDPDLGVYVKDLETVMRGRERWEAGACDEASAEEKCEEGDGSGGVDAVAAFDGRRVVLVDNNPLSFLANPSNGILVSNFYDDPKDATLDAVLELLQELDGEDDVRPVLEERFGLKDALRDVSRNSATARPYSLHRMASQSRLLRFRIQSTRASCYHDRSQKNTLVMDETTILLVPAPGANPEFLATVEPSKSGAGGGDLPFEVILGSYTRDAWATMAPTPGSEPWKGVWLQSVDGRAKLPGFLKYLKDRKKAAFGRFEPATASGSAKGVFSVPFDQPPPPPGILAEGSDGSRDDLIYCRYIVDENLVGRGYRSSSSRGGAQPQQRGRTMQAQPKSQQKNTAPKVPPPKPAAKSSRASSGMLGNLLGATRRTNIKLDTVPVKRTASKAIGGGDGSAAGGSGAVLAKFRTEIEQKLLDFKHDNEQACCKVTISIADLIRELPLRQKGAVTMEVLKYIVYEQAEEIGEDMWVAHREPSDFMDEEAILAIYKEGKAPDDILEDINKGELPDAIIQQQKAMQAARLRQQEVIDRKKDQKRQAALVSSDDMGFTTLNTAKRDRRTIEEIQKEIKSSKRQKH